MRIVRALVVILALGLPTGALAQDLALGTVTCSNSGLISFNVYNLGTKPAAPYQVTITNSAGQLVSNLATQRPLNPGGSNSEQWQLQNISGLPTWANQNHRIVVDPTSSIADSNRANNGLSVFCPGGQTAGVAAPVAPSRPPATVPPQAPGQVGGVTITPSTATVAPGQTVQFAAQVSGLPTPTNLRWSMRGPRTPGANWGSLNAQGLYTAPAAPPSGQVLVVVTALGRFGEPLASASAPITFRAAPPALPGSPIAQVVNNIVQGQNKCRTGLTKNGLAQWRQAQQSWNGLSRADRLTAVTQIVANQLQGIAISVQTDPLIRTVARVTADARATKMTLSGNFTPPGRTPYYQVPHDMPLTDPPGINMGYRTFQHFLCYEAEVMRIRNLIRGRCAAIGQQILSQVRQATGARLTLSSYNQLMKPWQNAPLVDRLAASWMIERIAAEPNARPYQCDMSIAASDPSNYNVRIDARIVFLHDAEANRNGASYCGCP